MYYQPQSLDVIFNHPGERDRKLEGIQSLLKIFDLKVAQILYAHIPLTSFSNITKASLNNDGKVWSSLWAEREESECWRTSGNLVTASYILCDPVTLTSLQFLDNDIFLLPFSSRKSSLSGQFLLSVHTAASTLTSVMLITTVIRELPPVVVVIVIPPLSTMSGTWLVISCWLTKWINEYMMFSKLIA